MKLQKSLSRKYNQKEYHKWIVVLPEEEVKKANLKEGDELRIESDDGRIILRKTRDCGGDYAI